MNKKLIVAISFSMLVVLMSGSLAYGAVEGENMKVAATDIKLGGLFPLTGTLAGGGVEREAAFRIAIEEINADSTLLPDHTLVPLIKDTGTDPATGAQVAGEVISDGAVGIVGAASSSVSIAIASGPAKTSKVPQISYSSTNADLSDKDTYPYFLRVVPPDSVQGVALANIADEMGWGQVATLASSDDYGAGGIGNFETAAGDLGIDILASEKFTQGATDIKTQLQNIKDSGAKIIVLNVIVGDAITVFSQAGDLALTSENGYHWVGTDGSTQAAVFENSTTVKTNMQGMIGTAPNRGSGDVFEAFLDIWEDKDPADYAGAGDRTPNTYATFAYDAVYTFAHAFAAMIEAGTDYTDGDALLAELYNTDFTGATGPLTFDENGDRLGVYDVLNLQGDVFEIVGTWDLTNGLNLVEDIFWDGVSVTDTPGDGGSILPGFGFYMAFIALIAVPILRRRK